MKKTIFSVIFAVALILGSAGCGSELAAGAGGAAGGFAASETLRGIEKDLERREMVLIERWKDATEAGAKQEVFDMLELQIQQTRYGQAGVQTVQQAAGTDWKDPKAAGVIIAQLGTLA